MKEFIIVDNTNQINKYGFRITERALVDSHWKISDIGVPSYMVHDLSRPIGWIMPLAILIEPQIVRSVSWQYMIENTEDERLFDQLREKHQAKLAYSKTDEITYLKALIKSHLSDKARLMSNPVTSFVDNNLAVRVAPQIFELTNQDRDGLIPISRLNVIGPGVYRIGELLLFAHHYFRRSRFRLNSLNSDFLEKLQGLSEDLSPRIALDRHMIGLASDYSGVMELMYWRGPKFNDDLTSIQAGVTEHRTSNDERFWFGISKTEFWWKKQNDEHILEIEELIEDHIPKSNMDNGGTSNAFACRYIHSIVSHNTGIIRHLDGAIRAYSEDAYLERIDLSINKSGKHSDYKKLWRIDGAIDLVTWKTLITDYFRDNLLVGEYLGGEAEDDSNVTNMKISTLNEPNLSQYVPFSIAKGTGIRIAINCRQSSEANLFDGTHLAVSFDYLQINPEKYSCYLELEGIELIKILKKDNLNVKVQDSMEMVLFEDNYVNFPIMLHSIENLRENLDITIDALRNIVSVWNAEERDMVITFGVGFVIEGKQVIISVMGNITDIHLWLQSPLSKLPSSKSDIDEWTEKIANYLTDHFQTPLDELLLADTLMPTGVLSIQRKAIDLKYKFSKGVNGLDIQLQIPRNNKELYKLITQGKLAVVPGFVIQKSKCTRCHEDYSTCNCSKILDNTQQELTDVAPLTPIWTDRPRRMKLPK